MFVVLKINFIKIASLAFYHTQILVHLKLTQKMMCFKNSYNKTMHSQKDVQISYKRLR